MRLKNKIVLCTTAFFVILASCMAGEIGILDRSYSRLDTYLPRIAAEDPTLIFYADFRFGSGYGQAPVGWSTNNGGSLRFYVNHFGDEALTTEYLLVGDDTTGGYAYGNKTFTTGVTTGTLEFDFEVNYNTIGSTIKEQNVIMRDAAGITNVFQIKISYDYSLQEVTLTLESTTVTTKYDPARAYHVKVIFASSLLTMYVDGIQELSGVAYGGEIIQEIYIESTVASNRGYTCFDNIEVRSSSPVPEPDLFDISSIPDDDGIIDLDWSDVPLSTYKVFRDRQEIYKVDHLTPIATPSVSDYQDTTGAQGTFWYAIVATNASGDSVPSISKYVRVDYGMPASTWTPILDTITPNPSTTGDISLTWNMTTWPKIYNATDQFTDGTTNPWQIYAPATNATLTCASNVGPFAKALNLTDNDEIGRITPYRTFPGVTKGTVEVWLYFTRTDRQLDISLYDLAISLAGPTMVFDLDGGVYVWNHQSRCSSALFNYTIYTPYRLRIDYDSSTKKGNVSINDVLIADNYEYWETTSTITIRHLNIASQYHETGQVVYVAYPGYTAVSPYLPGDNALGRANVTNYKVYRNTSQITDVSGLTPIATVTENSYTDHVTTSGTYWYAIVATNETNSPISNSESVIVDISKPFTSFTANKTSIRVNDWIQFNDTTYGGNAPLAYQWNFGDGPLNETTQNVTHQFTSEGVFMVILTVNDTEDDKSVYSMQINVILDTVPVASFTANATSILVGQSILFNDTTMGGNTPLAYQWNFGDNPTNTTTQNVTHQFMTAGVFTVILTVNDTDGNASVFSMEITVTPDIYQNGQQFILTPGAHQVTILETDGTTILMEFSITVLTTMEMSVTVTPSNPASASLLHALRFFIIDVKSGTYAPSVQVKFYYSDAGLTDAQESALSAYYLGPVKWDNVGGTVYKSENCIYTTLNHFSTYAVAWVESENGLPDMVIWIIFIGASVIIIFVIFKLRGGKKGGSGPQDGFEDLFDTFDEV